MRNIWLLFVVIFNAAISFAQTHNLYDAEGKRHGKWQKKYENTNQLRYEGTFDHGKEVGEFKFYKPSSGKNPTAIKIFSTYTDTVQVAYFTNKKKVISKGAMIDKDRVGNWIYYHKDYSKVMMTEVYQLGQLHGDRITYFENAQIAEKTTYIHGKKHGKSSFYSEDGIIIKEFTYEHGELHGATRYYDIKGNIKIEGNYKRDRKDGIWKYYEDKKLVDKKTFPLYKKRS